LVYAKFVLKDLIGKKHRLCQVSGGKYIPNDDW